jgi:hypothetical protein
MANIRRETMLTIKVLSVVAIICSLLCAPVSSSAVVKAGGSVNNKSDSTGSPSGNKISRVTAVVKELRNNILVLEDNRRFDLAGVDVINKKTGKRTEGKTVVEMMFINDTLKQVVIH